MSKKVNTWEIANDIEEQIDNENTLEDLDFSFDEDEEKEDAELSISISGEIEHPMSGWNESFNTAIDVEGEGRITTDGKIHIKGTFKMEVGPASSTDDELIKNHRWAEVGEEEEFDYTADDVEDFIEFLKEIPQ